MHCELSIDENKFLMEQEVKAWGVMQSTSEEPAYKESNIKELKNKEFFKGYKWAIDDVCTILMNMVDNHQFDPTSPESISQEQSDWIQQLMSGDVCMQLFSILDDEYADSDDLPISTEE